MAEISNRRIALIMGPPAHGKSMSLRNLRNPKRKVVFNTDRKALPFKSEFVNVHINDPYEVLSYMDEIAKQPDDVVDTIIIDTITFLMDMFETKYVATATNTQTAWGAYAQFYKQVIDKALASNKTVIVLAHEKKVMNESEMVLETKVPVKGSVGHTGVEANFEVVLAAKKKAISKLDYLDQTPLLKNDDEEDLGMMYVFQTKIDKDTLQEKMRSPLGMWKKEERFINNDIQNVIDRLNEYYSPVA